MGGQIYPPFDPAIGFYAVRASDLPELVDVVPTVADPTATVTVLLETVDGVDVMVGPQVPSLPDHRILVTVTSADGADTRRYAIGLLPDDFPWLTVSRPGTPSPGWYLLASYTMGRHPAGVSDYLMALDDRGTPGWWRRAYDAAFDLRVGQDGRLTYAGLEEATSTEPAGVTFDAGYHTTAVTAVDTTPAPFLGTNIHEHSRLADGGAIVLYNHLRLEDLTPWGGLPDTAVVHNTIQELGPTGVVRFEWDTVGAVDYDGLSPAHLAIVGDGWSPVHVNSVEIDPADGHLVVSLRMSSQVVKIARFDDVIAGRPVAAGEIAWRLGGAQSDFTFVGDTRPSGFTGFSLQHSARMTGPDTLAVFDNSLSYDLGDVGPARFVEYALDTSAWTATRLVEYSRPGGTSSPSCGSVQRLGDGHVVIGWGAIDVPSAQPPDLTELDENGDVQLELTLPGGLWSYRVWKVEGDPLTGTWVPPG